MRKKIFPVIPGILFLGLTLFGFYDILPVFAQEMGSQNFKIQGGNFNMTSGNKSSTNFKLSDVVGQNAAGVFASKGYIIQAGFLNGAAGSVFSFSVSPATVDFGNLLANLPSSRNITIRISNGDVPGYTVKVTENQPLTTLAGASIPDTLCDKSDNPCTQTKANIWELSDTYGFGYRMSGMTVPKDFGKENYFRPFAASKRDENPIIIMESKARKVTDAANMTVKVNIARSQAVGQYRNVLTYTAIAGI
jgi:hypothetical protein